jgi:hypothetical protein
MGTPLALSSYLAAGKAAGVEPVICIENRSGSFSDAELSLEVKLAFAAWWHASERERSLWQKLRFESRSRCPLEGGGVLASLVVPSSVGGGSGVQDLGPSRPFEVPAYSCSLVGSSISCRTNSMTLGWGGPASVRYTQSADGTLVRVEVVGAARAVMSPHVDWQPLGQALASGLAASKGGVPADWQGRLQSLAAASSPDLDALSAFVGELALREVRADKDPVFQKAMDEFARSNLKEVNAVTYRPRLPLFSTLMHEVGHIFGMDHADNPAADSVTGFASGQKVGQGQQAKTDLAVMAYALPYFYLTADDRAGMRSAAGLIPGVSAR